jgi:nucleoside-diphosphate-sugar epimerase
MLKKLLMINIILQILYNNVYGYINLPSYLNRKELIYLATLSASNLLKVNKTNPICVIGASGETGQECVKLLANQKQYVRAVSRKMIEFNDININSIKYIEKKKVDIKDNSLINDIIKGSSFVIFLANAKKYNRYSKSDIEEFQNYEDIDVFSLKNIIKSCIRYKIPRLIYVSASCRSCNDDNMLDIDKISGLKCDNCISKQLGEKIIRKYYKENNKPNVHYTIIRTGYLFNGNNRNINDIEINQDYSKSGMISRTDLANICINAALSPNTIDSTFEAYYRDTTQPYDIKESLTKCTNLGKSQEECFFGSSFKNRKPKNIDEIRNTELKGSLFTTGYEHNGNSWYELFKNLKKDDVNMHNY